MPANLIDARSGRENLKPGDVVRYPDFNGRPDGFTVLYVQVTILSGWIRIRRLSGTTQEVPVMVRWTHPEHFLRWVAFIPS